jgi:cation diffusion facilitator CzcD-associated flavoprotein CzcO
MAESNVDVVTDGIVEITEKSVITRNSAGDLQEHLVDTIVYGTGFKVTNQPVAEGIVGRDGRTLAEHWTPSMHALYGTTIPYFPNLFFLIGPNTGLGHNSLLIMSEAQTNYMVQAINQMDVKGIAAIEPLEQVEQAYNDEIQRKLRNTVWNTGGCASWYLDSTGRNTTVWPDYSFVFERMLRKCDLSEYMITPKTVKKGTPRVHEPSATA